MSNTNTKRQVITVLAVIAMVLIAGVPIIGVVAGELGDEGCGDEFQAAAERNINPDDGFVGKVVGSYGASIDSVVQNVIDPCWAEQSGEDPNKSINDTYQSALERYDVVEQKSRITDSIAVDAETSKQPVRESATSSMGTYYYNDTANATEEGFLQAGTDSIDNDYRFREAGAVLNYNNDLRYVQNGVYEELAAENATEHLHVYVNGTEVTTPSNSADITFSVPDNESDTRNGSDGVAYTLANSDTLRAGTITVNGTAYTFEDNLAVTMTDPAGELQEVPIVGRDLGTEYGSTAYTPEVSPSEADIVAATDGSGDYESIHTAMGAATDGQTIYVESGDYSAPGTFTETSANITVIAEPGAVYNSEQYSAIRPSANLTIKGLTIDGPTHVFDIQSASSVVELDYVTVQNVSTGLVDTGNSVSGYTGTLNNTLLLSGTNKLGEFGSSAVEGEEFHTRQFDSYTQNYIDQQLTDRAEILNAFGTTSEGFVSDLWARHQAGDVGPDYYGGWEKLAQDGLSEDDLGTRVWLDIQYDRMGYSSLNETRATTDVVVESGSTVYGNAQEGNAVTLSSDKTYSGHIWTKHPPASGEWSTNTTYSTDNLGGPLFVTYYGQETKIEDGNLTTEVVSKTVAVTGTFSFDSITTQGGESITTASHDTDNYRASTDPYNASSVVDDMASQDDRMENYRDAAAENDDGSGGGGAGDGCGISFFGVCSGISSMQISLLGGFIVLIVAGYVFRPLLGTLQNLTE
ncbi:hypothetical protein OB920_13130 [Halobacteria archaeon HArc-gm2]|nr:hypothetical protein [Halobacteria archaeon HArc-gm2]